MRNAAFQQEEWKMGLNERTTGELESCARSFVSQQEVSRRPPLVSGRSWSWKWD